MRKRNVLVAMLLGLVMISSVFVSAAGIQVTVDNQPLNFDQPPVIIDGRTVVPVAQIFRSLGAEVEWDAETRTVYASRGSDEIVIQIDNRRPTVNGQVIEIDVPATIVGGRTMVPARFIAESLGAHVGWNEQTSTVIIQTDAFQSTSQPKPEAQETPAEIPSETVSQQNAVRSAKNYLNFTAFSRSGLIRQLEFEGYSKEDATYGVDNSGANWMEQALKSAKNYLDFMSFSESGLIRQLEFEGFTAEEARYGVANSGADWMEQAAKSAKKYLDFMPFSRSGLIQQLEFEGFTNEQAVFGVNSVGL